MRRIGVIATMVAALSAGCGGAGGPEPGGIYVLDGTTTMWDGGPLTGDQVSLDPGSIVRVIEVGESSMGNRFVRVHVERGVEDAIFGDNTTGESGYIAADEFSGSPTAAP